MTISLNGNNTQVTTPVNVLTFEPMLHQSPFLHCYTKTKQPYLENPHPCKSSVYATLLHKSSVLTFNNSSTIVGVPAATGVSHSTFCHNDSHQDSCTSLKSKTKQYQLDYDLETAVLVGGLRSEYYPAISYHHPQRWEKRQIMTLSNAI